MINTGADAWPQKPTRKGVRATVKRGTKRKIKRPMRGLRK